MSRTATIVGVGAITGVALNHLLTKPRIKVAQTATEDDELAIIDEGLLQAGAEPGSSAQQTLIEEDNGVVGGVLNTVGSIVGSFAPQIATKLIPRKVPISGAIGKAGGAVTAVVEGEKVVRYSNDGLRNKHTKEMKEAQDEYGIDVTGMNARMDTVTEIVDTHHKTVDTRYEDPRKEGAEVLGTVVGDDLGSGIVDAVIDIPAGLEKAPTTGIEFGNHFITDVELDIEKAKQGEITSDLLLLPITAPTRILAEGIVNNDETPEFVKEGFEMIPEIPSIKFDPEPAPTQAPKDPPREKKTFDLASWDRKTAEWFPPTNWKIVGCKIDKVYSKTQPKWGRNWGWDHRIIWVADGPRLKLTVTMEPKNWDGGAAPVASTGTFKGQFASAGTGFEGAGDEMKKAQNVIDTTLGNLIPGVSF